ncbi:hypothetical protein CK203_030299 [Vitis vinifera]|uniref:Alpha-ketoglutarate-dependent dioxygenase AlkB-like domain-containing protein n=1 Tax=Vitis vinifera TaxID=29760 RepID=A0A438IVL8_VITVI|nr:hypothetical protein CK203_030299 [Vitis vinifera]
MIQIKMVKKCRDLGVGPGGFYRPGYQDGAKLRLQMMCLGMNWDPQTRKYEKWHPLDGSETPDIPHEFSVLVERAIQDSQSLIKKNSGENNVEDTLPRMSPNICIVNFYTTSGRLGLHQDRDESEESLLKGLPVVSFSLGDSAEFLYGNQRNVDAAAWKLSYHISTSNTQITWCSIFIPILHGRGMSDFVTSDSDGTKVMVAFYFKSKAKFR